MNEELAFELLSDGVVVILEPNENVALNDFLPESVGVISGF